MRIVVIVLLVLVLLFAAVFVIGGMMLDKNYELERSMVIAAPPAAVHALVGDLKRWDDWTPWKSHDETIKVTLGEKTTGVGASQTWTAKEGDGQLTFTKSDPNTGIEYDMAFVSGENRFESQGKVTYAVVPGGTQVTWSMKGTIDQAIVGGYIATAMDAAVGPMFEEGLQKLKNAVENPEAPKPGEKPEVPEKPEMPEKPETPEKPTVPAGSGG